MVVGFGVRGSMMRVMIRRVGLEAHMFLGECAKNVSILRRNAGIPCWRVYSKI